MRQTALGGLASTCLESSINISSDPINGKWRRIIIMDRLGEGDKQRKQINADMNLQQI